MNRTVYALTLTRHVTESQLLLTTFGGTTGHSPQVGF